LSLQPRSSLANANARASNVRFVEVDPDTLPLMPSGFADRSQSAMIGASLSPLVESFIQ
jgi:hypothetical protein